MAIGGTSRILPLMLATLGLACAQTSAVPLTGPMRDASTSYFVENHGRDDKGLDVMIRDTLLAHGARATSGTREQRPEDVDYVVRYVERWGWALRTFLREITINVQSASSGAIFATSHAYHGGFASIGKSPGEIVEAATARLFTDESSVAAE